jgi:hypothetical protein
MNIEGIPIKQLWKLLSWLPKFILRRKFNPETLAELIYIDIMARHHSATMNLGESASFEVWLQLINLSPFEVELDRGSFELLCGPALSASILKRQKIAPGEITSLRVHGSITDGQATQIARIFSADKSNSVGLAGHIDFNCALHPFAKNIGHLDGINPRILNANAR